MNMKIASIILAVLVIAVGGYVTFVGPIPGMAMSQSTTGGTSNGKLNADVVCNSALSYMTFTDDASAQVFVQECKEGKHPEVFDHYKAQMNLGDGKAI